MSETPTRNREQWLKDFTAAALPLVREKTGLSLDKPIQISVGFPSRKGVRRKTGNMALGECHHHGGNRKYHHIFIHPYEVNPVSVGGTIMHEMLHAMLPAGTGHRKPFSQAAKKLGLDGKPTSTSLAEGSDLEAHVKKLVAELGPYPHDDSVIVDSQPQATRQLKVMCPLCGYICRVTSKWIDEAGTPICPQDMIPMEEAGVEDEAQTPLYVEEQTVTYRVKATNKQRKLANAVGQKLVYDPRWMLQMHRKGGDIIWHVLDLGPSTVAYEFTAETGETKVVEKAVLGLSQIRHYRAESKADALALLEGLRDGTFTPESLDLKDDDDDPKLLDESWFGDDDEITDEADDEEETFDHEDGDPRFPWEIAKGITLEDIDPDKEADRREGWADR